MIKPKSRQNFDVKHPVRNPQLDPPLSTWHSNKLSQFQQLLTLGLKNLFRIPSSPYLLYCIPLCIPSNVNPYDSINSLIPSSNSVNPRLLELSMNRQTRKALVQSATQASRLQVESVKSQKLPPLRCVAFFFQASQSMIWSRLCLQSNRTCTCNTFLKSKCWFTRMTKIVENKNE